MSDPDDPFAEVDAAWEARIERDRAAAGAKAAAREGLVRLDTRPQAEATEALNRCLPSMRDAEALFTLVVEALGHRGSLDPWSTPDERCLLVHDRERPEWVVPQRLLYLVTDWAPPPMIPVHIELPPDMERRNKRLQERLAREAEARAQSEVVALAPGGRPGRVAMHLRDAVYQITYGARGQAIEWMASRGDGWASSEPERFPFTLDPHAQPPQVPPIPLLTDARLVPGISLAQLAQLVAEMPIEEAIPARVRLPVPQPGGATGAFQRALNALRMAEWEDRAENAACHVVVDAWNASAMVYGADFDAAWADWQDLVRAALPLPPVPARPAPAIPEPVPMEPEAPTAAQGPNDPATMSMSASFEIVIHPPLILDWPEVRAENVPAVALPLPERPDVPRELLALGFSRTIRLFGDHGEVGFAFVRDDEGGFTLVGDEAVAALNLAALEADMVRIWNEVRSEYETSGHGDRPWRRYPYAMQTYRVWSDDGRTPQFRGSSTSWSAAWGQDGWSPDLRRHVMRGRIEPIAANG